MNKLVLEKLLHLYKLVPEKTNVDLEINYDDEEPCSKCGCEESGCYEHGCMSEDWEDES